MRILALVLLFLTPNQQVENPAVRTLLFLARHQNDDGSWGRRLETCRCPVRGDESPLPSIPIDEGLRKRFSALLDLLGDDQVAVRERAQKDLQGLGADAVPLLLEQVHHRDPEVRGRCRDVLRAEHRWKPLGMSIHVALPEREDFALKMTSLALLAFSGTGYTHFSKDQFSDPVPPNRTYQFGEIVKKGLRWLLDQEKEDGSFTSGRPELNTLAALTLAEYYGMTAMEPIKEPAARALAFARDQRSTDPDVLVWKGLLLKTAFMGELIPDPAKDLADLGEMTERGTTPLSISGSLLLSTLGRRSCDGARERFGELDWEAMTPEDRFMASLTVVRVFKHDNPKRQAWQDLLRWEWYPAQIATLDCGYGSLKCFPDCFETRILAALYTQLIFHQHYRYSSALLGQPL